MKRGTPPARSATAWRAAAAAAYLLLGACASIPDSVRQLPADAGPLELAATPFFPQQRYQCGPAALATVLSGSGLDIEPPELVARVYVPALAGSLQAEMLAASRTSGRLAYPVDGTLAALRRELAAGRPVVVLQNLGVAAIPRWHYAVLVGIDPGADEVILRSGTDRRRVTPVSVFLRTWERSDYWAFVVLRPGELPAAPDRDRYFRAAAAFGQAASPEDASLAWQAALEAWPEHPVALFGLGNARLASGDPAGAERRYRQLLDQDSSQAAVRNNLALALAAEGRYAQARAEIDRAIANNDDPDLAPELEDTAHSIGAMQDSPGDGHDQRLRP